jgi:hypothetical protein
VRGEKLLWDRRCPVADRYRSYFDLVVAADWYVFPEPDENQTSSLPRHHHHLCSSCRSELRYKTHTPLIDWIDRGVSLFLHEYHDDLLHTLRELLRPGGEALIIAPRRGRTLAAFVERAKQDTVVVHPALHPIYLCCGQAGPLTSFSALSKEWRVQVDEEYDRLVWSRHQELLSHGISGGGSAESDQTATAATYQPDIHYPWLLRLIHP